MQTLVGKVINGNSIQVSGSIVPQVLLSGHLSSSIVLKGSIYVPEVVGEATEYYAGDYEVTPCANKQVVLNTSKMIMKQDLTVKEIPYAEVKNNVKGITVTIA